METMNSNSFLIAYNILLATINILKEKGYLAQASWSGGSPSSVPRRTTNDYYTRKPESGLSIPHEKAKKDEKYYVEISEVPKIKLHPERDYNKLKTGQDISSEIISPEPAELEGIISEKVEYFQKPNILDEDLSFDEYKSLLASIRYQTENITYEKNQATIHTFLSHLPQIKVDFSDREKIELKGISSIVPRKTFSLKVVYLNDPQSSNLQDPWEKISLEGSEDILNQLKVRIAVANRITELGNIEINIIGSKNEINYSMQINKSKESLTKGYNLLIDLVWFLEMLI
ncbi:MAG: hypothetical protein ACW99F_12375 [Candidatus Hodarchaeales archaeon]